MTRCTLRCTLVGAALIGAGLVMIALVPKDPPADAGGVSLPAIIPPAAMTQAVPVASQRQVAPVRVEAPGTVAPMRTR